MTKKYQKRREWTLTDENELRAAWEKRHKNETGTAFCRRFATKVERTAAAVESKRRLMKLWVNPPKVKSCRFTPPVCAGPFELASQCVEVQT